MNVHFADDNDGLAVGEQELPELVTRLDETSTRSVMEISAEKTKLMFNHNTTGNTDVTVHVLKQGNVQQFTYLIPNQQ